MDFKSRKENGYSRYAVIDKSDNRIIGSCGFAKLENGEVELGYLLARDFWGKGFAAEAGRACAKYGFEKLDLNKLVALTDIEHIQTHRVLEKIGFRKRGIENFYGDEDLVFELKSQDFTL